LDPQTLFTSNTAAVLEYEYREMKYRKKVIRVRKEKKKKAFGKKTTLVFRLFF